MTPQDESTLALRLQLNQLPCPTCSSHELVPLFQCDYYPDGCLWLVRCETCRAQYHLDHRSGPAWMDDVRTIAPAEPASTEHSERTEEGLPCESMR